MAARPQRAWAGQWRAAPPFLAAFTAYWLLALAADSAGGGLRVQAALGAVTWAALGVALWTAPRALRGPVVAMVVVATACECLGSLVWGAYVYRYHNLPAYVPPGHGLFYLAALRLAALPLVRRHGRAIVLAVAASSALWAAHGLAVWPRDLVGALCWLCLAYFLRRGRDPVLLAVTFAVTMVLEFYGTALGAWHWAAILPGTGLSAGNPPAAIAAGYCGLDLLARRLVRCAPRLAGLLPVSTRGREALAALLGAEPGPLHPEPLRYDDGGSSPQRPAFAQSGQGGREPAR